MLIIGAEHAFLNQSERLKMQREVRGETLCLEAVFLVYLLLSVGALFLSTS